MMTYALFLDDERDPPADGRRWVIARSSQDAKEVFQRLGVPSFISFDHDLGGDDTSIKFVDWLIGLALDLKDLGVASNLIAFPRDYTIHSQNPVGAQNIDAKMKSFIRFLDS